MPISPTLELIHPQTEEVLYEFVAPRFGDKGVILGREAMIGWFGNSKEMGLISLDHLVIEALNWRHGHGELIIRDISKNGTTPAHLTLDELPSYISGAESAYLVIKLAQSPIGVRVRYAGEMGVAFSDIGDFRDVQGLPLELLSAPLIASTLARLGADPDASFTYLESPQLNREQRDVLRMVLDEADDGGGDPDLKCEISPAELARHINDHSAEALARQLGTERYRVVLRRVNCHGERIDLHTDHTPRTLQVLLSEAHEFEGCDLTYVNRMGIHRLNRVAGALTVHDRHIAHGVTEHVSGTRDSLFLLASP